MHWRAAVVKERLFFGFDRSARLHDLNLAPMSDPSRSFAARKARPTGNVAKVYLAQKVWNPSPASCEHLAV